MRGVRFAASITVAISLTVGVGAGVPAGAATSRDWDRRIAPLAHQVERLRGLEFEHPVPIRVLGNRAFEKRYGASQEVTKADRKELERTNAAFLAVGLLDAPMDHDVLTDAYASQVLGFYDDRRKEIVVRGEGLDTAPTRATLAHELTHALQDQHFDLQKLRAKARGTESAVPNALLEGDATRIGDRYKEGLSQSERDAIDAHERTVSADATALPPIVGVSAAGSYALGEVAALMLEADGKQKAIDAALGSPPLDDIVLLDPAALLNGFSAIEVPAPELASGEQALGKSFPWGAWGLYLIFAARLPADDSLAAAERWGGDSYQVFERASTPCVRIVATGRNGSADTEAIAATFRAWTAAAPSDAQTSVTGDRVTFTSCAPGGGTTPVSEAALTRALTHIALRNSIAVGAVGSNLSASTATCIADEVLELPEVSAAIASITALDSEPAADFETTLQNAVLQHAPAIRARCA
jgi:hypothetical protein